MKRKKVKSLDNEKRERSSNAWFGLFYGISTIVGYLMPNPFSTYILNI